MKNKWLLISSGLIFVIVTLYLAYSKFNQFVEIHPERGNISEAVYGLGKVKSQKRFEVIVGIISTVTKRFVNEGDLVEKGRPLVEVNGQTVFRAPFKGTITFANLYAGETAIPNSPIIRLEDLENKYIELSLEQQSALRVKLGQTVQVSFESLRGKNLLGKVSALFPRQDEFIVHIQVDSLDANILPGMTADVMIEIGSIKNAIVLPLTAVKNGMIVVKRNGHWEKIKVEVGQIDGLFAEIKDPALTEQDSVRIKAGG